MKTQILIGTMSLLAGSLLAADAKEEIKAAAAKLGESGYCWKMTTESAGGGGGGGGGGRMTPGPVEGKAGKDGTICLKMTRGETTTEAFLKGEKGAVKTQDGWQALSELSQAGGGGGGGGGGGQGRGNFLGRMLRNYKAPAVQAAEIVGKVKELTKDGDACAGALTEEGAKSLMTLGARGGNAPEVSDAKGTFKAWVKDGVLAKYQYNVQGKMSFNGNEREINRTVTVEIKDVGKTAVEVPAEAKSKM
jgi:hypothetical protein